MHTCQVGTLVQQLTGLFTIVRGILPVDDEYSVQNLYYSCHKIVISRPARTLPIRYGQRNIVCIRTRGTSPEDFWESTLTSALTYETSQLPTIHTSDFRMAQSGPGP